MSLKVWQRRLAVLSLLLFCLSVTGWLARQLWQAEKTQWETQARAETVQLTQTLHSWMESANAPLSALAAMLEREPELSKADFLNALDSMASRSTAVFLTEVGLFHQTDTQWALRASSSSTDDAKLPNAKHLAAGAKLRQALEVASQRSNEWVMSEPDLQDRSTVYLVMTPAAAQQEFVAGVLELEQLIGSLLKDRAPEGIYLDVYTERRDGSGQDLLFTRFATGTQAITFNSKIAVSGSVFNLTWHVTDQFHPNTRLTTAWITAVAGVLVSVLLALVLHWQLRAHEVITQRVNTATATLETERARLQHILDLAPVGVGISVQGIMRYANPRMVELGGTEVGKPALSRFVDPEERHKMVALLDTQSTLMNHPLQFLDQNNQPRDALFTAIKHTYEGADAVLGWAVDVTSIRATERIMAEAKDKAEEATRAKSYFLANMSHEIRTPMNAIIGMSHLALDCPLDAQPRSHIEKVHRAAKNLLHIINDILDFSKIEAGHLTVESIPFEVGHVLTQLSHLIAFKIEEKGIQLVFDVPDATSTTTTPLPAVLRGDPLRLGQVLLNLSNNAIKFAAEGQIVVGVRAEPQTTQPNAPVELHFWVKDEGIGISTAQQAKLFQSFSQADTSTTRKYGGTGLGLAISKALVEAMGGRIWVESVAGQGATFHFSVVCEQVTPSARTPQAHLQAHLPPTEPHQGKRDTQPPPISTAPQQPPLSTPLSADIHPMLNQLEALITDCDAVAADLGEQVRALCKATPCAAQANKLHQLLQDFDFDAALPLVQALRSSALSHTAA